MNDLKIMKLLLIHGVILTIWAKVQYETHYTHYQNIIHECLLAGETFVINGVKITATQQERQEWLQSLPPNCKAVQNYLESLNSIAGRKVKACRERTYRD